MGQDFLSSNCSHNPLPVKAHISSKRCKPQTDADNSNKSSAYIIQAIHTVRKWEILYSLWFVMPRRPPRDSVGSVGGARRPESPGCTVRYCMVGRSILNSVALQNRMSLTARRMPYHRTIYCNACKLSRSVLQVCVRRLIFVCTSVLRSLDRGRSCVL